ncbi:hypothetical protein DFP74_0518 [Nocardiopsis sp. Huas11]|nr:hypothetical protein DFP74_0518 [Nocardiopsis sp. Huas11]
MTEVDQVRATQAHREQRSRKQIPKVRLTASAAVVRGYGEVVG